MSVVRLHIMALQIGDFGMARDIAGSGGGSDYYKSHGGIIPVKWTAPEVSSNLYSHILLIWNALPSECM